MRIVIFGYKGMLGHDIKEYLLDRHDLILMDIEECDITNRRQLASFFNTEKFDGIINCSAYTAVDKAEKEKGLAALVNSVAVKRMSDLCAEYDRFLYHISTDFVFSGSRKPYYEQDITEPVNYYGLTKKWGEEHIKLRKQTLIRISWLFGKNGNNFVNKILEKLKKGKRFKVVEDQFGCPTYTVDVAWAIDIMLNYIRSGVWHITNKCNGISWYDFAVKIAELTNYNIGLIIPSSTLDFDSLAMRPSKVVLSTKKIEKTLNVKMRTWEDALTSYLMEINEI